MSEQEVILKTDVPATVESLQEDFHALGVRPGMVLMVHSSLSAIGWVCGGTLWRLSSPSRKSWRAAGTLVIPAHSTDLTEPGKWESPPVPESWWPVIRENMPAYDLRSYPHSLHGHCQRDMSVASKGAFTAAHIHTFPLCMWPPCSQEIIDNHELAYGMGEHSTACKSLRFARSRPAPGSGSWKQYLDASRRIQGRCFQANTS